MKRIFVCSPLSGDVVKNTEIAKALCRALVRAGHSPFASHLFFPLFLNELMPGDRSAGIAAGIQWLRASDELWCYADSYVLCSLGMKAEVDVAHEQGIPVQFMPPLFDQVWHDLRVQGI